VDRDRWIEHVRHAENSAWPEVKLRPYYFLSQLVLPNRLLCAGRPSKLAIARPRRRSRGRGQLAAERMLHVTGVTSVPDRRRDSPQADFAVLLAVNRLGLLVRPKLIAIH
jgi:hypothetical protein